MADVVLTREDANTELAVLVEWLVADGAEVRRGEPVCVVETSKASIEVEAPAAGILVHLYGQGAEVEPGGRVAVVAESEEELARARQRGGAEPAAASARGAAPGRATAKAVELARAHGVDLAEIDKPGFVTADDVRDWLRRRDGAKASGTAALLAGISTEGVSLPASFHSDEAEGALEPGFLERLRSDPESFRALPSEEKCDAYRAHGAHIGANVVLEEGVLLVAPRIVVGDDVRIGRNATVRCEEAFAIGSVTHVGPNLEVACRRAFIGEGVHAGRNIRIGGGGHRDPWAVLAVGDLTFLGDEIFVNPCRPVLIGAEVYLTMRSVLVTHNIGHSVLEGFENRFAPIVLEDRSQIGIGTVVYAGCRVGREAIVGSSSYVVSDVPAGKLAIGVPARVVGDSRHRPSRARQVELGEQIVESLADLLSHKGFPVQPIGRPGLRGFSVERDGRIHAAVFVERLPGLDAVEVDADQLVVLTLDYGGGDPPAGRTVLDLLARRLYGQERGSPFVDSVREHCRKRGMRLEPGPWRYRDGWI
jgi:acetyltransferase-like isoleucine patch superfamily enzyme